MSNFNCENIVDLLNMIDINLVKNLNDNVVISGSTALYYFLKEKQWLINPKFYSNNINIFYTKINKDIKDIENNIIDINNLDDKVKFLNPIFNESIQIHDKGYNNLYKDIDNFSSVKFIKNKIIINLIQINISTNTNVIKSINDIFDLDICKIIFDGNSLFSLNETIFRLFPENKQIIIKKVTLGNKNMLLSTDQTIFKSVSLQTIKKYYSLKNKSSIDQNILKIFNEQNNIFDYLISIDDPEIKTFWLLNIVNKLKFKRLLKYTDKGIVFIINDSTEISVPVY
jgi:hypothetical protein